MSLPPVSAAPAAPLAPASPQVAPTTLPPESPESEQRRLSIFNASKNRPSTLQNLPWWGQFATSAMRLIEMLPFGAAATTAIGKVEGVNVNKIRGLEAAQSGAEVHVPRSVLGMGIPEVIGGGQSLGDLLGGIATFGATIDAIPGKAAVGAADAIIKTMTKVGLSYGAGGAAEAAQQPGATAESIILTGITSGAVPAAYVAVPGFLHTISKPLWVKYFGDKTPWQVSVAQLKDYQTWVREQVAPKLDATLHEVHAAEAVPAAEPTAAEVSPETPVSPSGETPSPPGVGAPVEKIDESPAVYTPPAVTPEAVASPTKPPKAPTGVPGQAEAPKAPGAEATKAEPLGTSEQLPKAEPVSNADQLPVSAKPAVEAPGQTVPPGVEAAGRVSVGDPYVTGMRVNVLATQPVDGGGKPIATDIEGPSIKTIGEVVGEKNGIQSVVVRERAMNAKELSEAKARAEKNVELAKKMGNDTTPWEAELSEINAAIAKQLPQAKPTPELPAPKTPEELTGFAEKFSSDTSPVRYVAEEIPTGYQVKDTRTGRVESTWPPAKGQGRAEVESAASEHAISLNMADTMNERLAGNNQSALSTSAVPNGVVGRLKQRYYTLSQGIRMRLAAEDRAFASGEKAAQYQQRIRDAAEPDAYTLAQGIRMRLAAESRGESGGRKLAAADATELADYAKERLPSAVFYKAKAALDNVTTEYQAIKAMYAIDQIADTVAHQGAARELRDLRKDAEGWLSKMPSSQADLANELRGILDSVPGTKSTAATIKKAQVLLDDAERLGDKASISDIKEARDTIRASQGKQLADMTTAELNDYTDALKSIAGRRRVLNNIALGAEKLDRAETVARHVEAATTGNLPSHEGIVGPVRNWLGRQLAWDSGFTWTLQRIFGRDAGQKLVDDMLDLRGKTLGATQKMSHLLADAISTGSESGKALQKKLKKPFFDRPLEIGLDAKGKVVMFNPTVDQVIDIVGRFERQVSHDSMVLPDAKGEHIDTGKAEYDVRLSPSVLSKLVQRFHASGFESYFQELRKAFNDPDNLALTRQLHEQQHGIPMTESAPGTYWPTSRYGGPSDAGTMGQGYAGDPSFTKDARVSSAPYLNEGATGTLNRHMQSMTKWGAHLAAGEFNKIWFDSAVQESLLSRLGKQGRDEANANIKDALAASQGMSGEKRRSIIDLALRSYANSTVVFSLPAAAAHAVSHETWAMTNLQALPLKNALAIAAKMGFGNSAQVDQVLSDPFLYQRNLAGLRAKTGTGASVAEGRTLMDKPGGVGRKISPITYGDQRGMRNAASLFLADAKAQGITDPAEQVAYAQKMQRRSILESQPGSDPYSQNYFTLPGRRSSFSQTFSMFLSAPLKNTNRIAVDVSELVRYPTTQNAATVAESAGAVMAIMGTRVAVKSAVRAALAGALGGYVAAWYAGEKDKGQQVLDELAGHIPGGREIVSAVNYATGGTSSRTFESMPDQVLNAAPKLVRAIVDLTETNAKIPTLRGPARAREEQQAQAQFYGIVRNTISLASFLGLPSGTPAQIARELMKNAATTDVQRTRQINALRAKGENAEADRLERLQTLPRRGLPKLPKMK
jgi:hypothetical protein